MDLTRLHRRNDGNHDLNQPFSQVHRRGGVFGHYLVRLFAEVEETMMRMGGCNCGAVRLEVRGEPVRVGVCHCLTCRKETGGPFMAFGVWDAGQVTVTGAVRSWTATTDHRHFCPVCGSAVFGTHDGDDEVEVRLGALDDAPSGLLPGYELWTGRRERWLQPVEGAKQFESTFQNAPGTAI